MIGIITKYYGNNNYGGIAQSYALQKYIEAMEMEAELICYETTTPRLFSETTNKPAITCIHNKFYCLPEKLKQKIENRLVNKIYGKRIEPQIELRKSAFARSRQQCRHSETVYTCASIGKTVDRYDFFIIGSDQVWHPEIIRPAYVCGFLSVGEKCISYASSIAVTSLPKEYGDFMKKNLSKFAWLSVRENNAKEYLEKTIDKSVDVVVDPTLLLCGSEWDKLAAGRMIEGKYIFVYLLGQSRKQRKKIKQIAKELNLPIVFLPHIEGKVRACDLGFGNVDLYDVDLPAFLSLIKFAEIVFTDSFHAAVFSILFKKKFWLLERIILHMGADMGSRTETLLANVGLMERRYLPCMDKIAAEINYDKVWERLEPLIAQSKDLLKKAIIGEHEGFDSAQMLDNLHS